MNTFDRHIIRRLVTGYLGLVVALILFFILLHYLEFVDDFLDRGATMTCIFTVYYPSYIPEIVRLISPLALFLACVYLTGKLAQELQLVALQMSGVSLYRLMRPYLVVALTITGLMIWFNGWIVPITNQTILEYDGKYLKNAPRQIDMNDIHRQNQPGSILTVGFYEQRSQTAHRISLQQFDESNKMIQRVDARTMQWVDSLELWRIPDAVVRDFMEDGREQRAEVIQLDTVLQIYPQNLARTERDIESMTIPVAAEYIDLLKRSGADNIGQPLVGYYSKYAYPFANLIVMLIGLPLAAVRRRGGQAVQLGIGLGIAFIYLALQKIAEPFGFSGQVSPLLTAWLPHAIFFIVALIMLFKTRK